MIQSDFLKRVFLAVFVCSSLCLLGCEDEGTTGPEAPDTYTQVDRMGIPGLNTIFNHAEVDPFDKGNYNTADPRNDLAAYQSQFETVLTAVGSQTPTATVVLLLPDELPVNLGSATSNFAVFDGRKPEDDVVDIALNLMVGDPSLHSDNVFANDVPFLSTFPFLTDPH